MNDAEIAGLKQLAWIVVSALICTAVLVKNPTPQMWQRRIIQMRAAGMAAGRAWREAVREFKSVYPECERRARTDV